MTELTFPRAHPDSDDPAELDLFSGSRFTKHCKRAVVGSSFNELRAHAGQRIKPGHPQQNGRHERMHLTLKKEATWPPGFNSLQQQERFVRKLAHWRMSSRTAARCRSASLALSVSTL
jgi:transposase InsO family protein